MPELEDDTSAERDGQLFTVLSALTDGESTDVVTSARGDRGFESWRKLHRRWGPCTAGRARSLFERGLVTTASDATRADGCHRKDGRSRETLLQLTRCQCTYHTHTLADDIRVSSLEALLSEGPREACSVESCEISVVCCLEKRKSKTHCGCTLHPGGDDQIDIGAFGKGKGKGKQGQQGRQAEQDEEQGLNRMLELWKAPSLPEGFLEQERAAQQRWLKGKEQEHEHNG